MRASWIRLSGEWAVPPRSRLVPERSWSRRPGGSNCQSQDRVGRPGVSEVRGIDNQARRRTYRAGLSKLPLDAGLEVSEAQVQIDCRDALASGLASLTSSSKIPESGRLDESQLRGREPAAAGRYTAPTVDRALQK